MNITKRQLRRIIKEEKAKLLNEQMPGVDRQVRELWDSEDEKDMQGQIESDMLQLTDILLEAEAKASEIAHKNQDPSYGEWAGGREADDLRLALQRVWEAFDVGGEL